MADLGDVENALQGFIASAIYPNGTSFPSGIEVDDTPVPVKVGRGWPLQPALKADLAAGVANVTVFSQPGSERNTTRFPKDWIKLTAGTPATEVALTDTTVTFSASEYVALSGGNNAVLGAGVSAALGWASPLADTQAPENAVVITRGNAYTYAIPQGSTPTQIAAAMAGIMAIPEGATSAGPVLTVPNAIDLVARTGGIGTMIRELRRQERLFQITIWCCTPEQRDAVTSFVDGAIAGVGTPNGIEFIPLPDGSMGRILYVRSMVLDHDELSGLFRRDLIYSVEYPTTETQPIAQIITGRTNMTGGEGDPGEGQPALTFNQ